MRVVKVLFVIIVVASMAYFGFGIYFTFSPDITNYSKRVEFDSDKWKDWKESEEASSLRWDMTHSLTKKYELVGMNEDKIIELLGPPTSQSLSEFRYYLGISRHGIDTGALVLEFENGIVVSYQIWHG